MAQASLLSRRRVDTFIQPGCHRGFTSVSRKLRKFKSADSLRGLTSSRHCSLMRTTSHSSDLFTRHTINNLHSIMPVRIFQDKMSPSLKAKLHKLLEFLPWNPNRQEMSVCPSTSPVSILDNQCYRR